MNLVTGDWIPVVFNDGTSTLVSLEKLYEKGDEISDFVLNPPQRISVMRLLICITQAALDGPEDEAEWLNCEKRIIPESIQYLESRINKFNLYDEKQPFLQVAGLDAIKEDDEYSVNISKLSVETPSGHNSTLFDHSSISEKQILNDADIAIGVLTLQNFATGGGQSKSIKWDGIAIDGSANVDDKGQSRKNNNFTKAPCLSQKLFSIAIGDYLLHTIWLNLIPKNHITKISKNMKFGKPLWDDFPEAYKTNSLDEIRLNYLSRLTPLSRFFLLDKANKQKSRFFTNGYSYEEDLHIIKEPMCTVIKNKEQENVYLKIDLSKHIWRELASVLMLKKSDSSVGGAECLANLKLLFQSQYTGNITLWSGGVVTDSKGGKFIDFAEWILSVPVRMIGESPLLRYKSGIQLADDGSSSLGRGISKYLEIYGDDKFQKDERGGFRKKSNKDWKLREKVLAIARTHYWQALDNSYQILIDTVINDASLDGEWRKRIFSAINSAFRYACPSNTPRQIQAFAQAQGFLRIKKADNNNG